MLPPVCEMLKHPTPQRNHALRLCAGPVFRVVVRLCARRAGALPPTRKKKALRFATALLFFFLRLPPAGCTCTAGFAPTDLFADQETPRRFPARRQKIGGTPSRAQPCTGGRFQRAPHLPQTPPHFASLRHRGGALVEVAPPHRLPPVPSWFFLASALCLIS